MVWCLKKQATSRSDIDQETDLDATNSTWLTEFSIQAYGVGCFTTKRTFVDHMIVIISVQNRYSRTRYNQSSIHFIADAMLERSGIKSLGVWSTKYTSQF